LRELKREQVPGMGADVAVLDRNPKALRRIAAQLGNRVAIKPSRAAS
jgi:hypothetical protein